MLREFGITPHMQQNVTLSLFLVFLLVASASDVRSYRLPNWLTGVGFVLGVSLSSFFGGWVGLQMSLLGAVAGLLPLFILFALRLWGAGDAKLMGAIGSFLGPEGVLWALFYGAIAGGVLSGVLWITAKPSEDRKKKKVPYGVALAAGGVIAWLRYGFVGGIE
jgi:prepilin peptidase CpaA